MNIDELRELLTRACDEQIARGVRVEPLAGNHDKMDCCCPMGAAMPRGGPYAYPTGWSVSNVLGIPVAQAWQFIRGFEEPRRGPEDRDPYRDLGREFRAKYAPEVSP